MTNRRHEAHQHVELQIESEFRELAEQHEGTAESFTNLHRRHSADGRVNVVANRTIQESDSTKSSGCKSQEVADNRLLVMPTEYTGSTGR